MFIVIETQSNGETAQTLTDSYADRNDAENKYHTVLAYASKSELPVHSATMLTDEGFYIKSECYKHESEVVNE